MSRHRGMTMIELLIVVGLFSALFSVMIGLLYNSDTFFTKGQNKIAEQCEARRIIDLVSRDLRSASPNWDADSTQFALAVSENYTRLDYYAPVFDSDNELSGLRKITIKRDPLDEGRLLMKSGTSSEAVVSENFDYVRFGCGCSGCASFNCTSLADDCPVVQVEVRTNIGDVFDLSTKVALRNTNSTVSNETEVDAPEEGEF